MSRSLPGHIEALLAGAGGSGDTAGQSWSGRDLSEKSAAHPFAGDTGLTPASWTDALEGLATGTATECDVVDALRDARVFVPVIAEVGLMEVGEDDLISDKEADMALVTLSAPDGRSALPVFTSVAALQGWHGQARPVPSWAPRAALAAAAEGAALLVVDPGANPTIVIRRPAMHSLAQQQPWIQPWNDDDVRAAFESAVAAEPAIRAVRCVAGAGVRTVDASGRVLPGGGAGPELGVVLELIDGLDRDALAGLTDRLQRAFADDPVIAERVDSIDLKFARAT